MDTCEQTRPVASGSAPYPDYTKRIAEYVATGRINPLVRTSSYLFIPR